MKKVKKTLCAVLLFVLILTAVNPLAHAVSGKIDRNIVAETSKTAVKIESEGIVLLKNEENFLPLADKKINVFGAGSVTPLLGGSGSGAISSDDPVTFYDALDSEGIEYNTELRKLYEINSLPNTIPTTQNTVVNNLFQLVLIKSTISEMSPKLLTDRVMKNAANFSDTAVIVISRTGIEGGDLKKEDARLSKNERGLVEKVTANFENVIVLFNISNIIEMDWLEEYDSIKVAAIIWIPGEFGMTGVARMLTGKVNPSGRLADTIAYKMEDYPSNVCFGSNKYKGANEHYVEYLEGIYVGYRYFETFAKDRVQFPFGYGLSYTKFKKQVTSFNVGGGKITVKIKVTNAGERAGKEVAQVYYSPPYTPGGIEKSAINLIGYGKTGMLKPGESENIKIEFDVDDMASYDYKNKEAWVLEKGNYSIIVAENAREHVKTFTYTVAKDKVIKKDKVTGTEIKNLFDFAYNGFPVLSRYGEQIKFPEFRQLEATPQVKSLDKLPEPTKEGKVPAMGVKHDKTITLADVHKDESLWEPFLDQLTLDEMALMVTDGGYRTRGVERLGIPKTWDNDGPSTVKGREGFLYVDCGTAYPCATAIACTWNKALAEEMGKCVGIEAANIGTHIWYAPGVNIHRSPLGGRNFEYYSEDPLLSGKTAVAVIEGAQSQGLVVTIKHFVLNDQETHRNGVMTWADEQTMREIYLKPFEITIKETGCCGVMSAFNRLGTTWCGASSELLNDLLRKEWGYVGFVVSDYSANFTGSGYMSPVLAVYAGNDTILTGLWFLNKPSHVTAVKQAYRRDPIGFGTALREACKNLCIAKMQTRVFSNPAEDYKPTLAGAMVKPEDWKFTPPYILSAVTYVLNNLFNVILYALARIV